MTIVTLQSLIKRKKKKKKKEKRKKRKMEATNNQEFVDLDIVMNIEAEKREESIVSISLVTFSHMKSNI